MIEQLFKYIKVLYDNIKFYSVKLYWKFEKDHIWVLSSGIAFNIIISIIPFFLIVLSLLGVYLEQLDEMQKVLDYINNLLPMQDEFKQKFMLQIHDRAVELTSNTFLSGAIGFAVLIWTMSSLFSTMRDVLNRIYNFDGYINFFTGKIRDFILTIVTLLLFVISLAFTSFLQYFENISKYVFNNIFYAGTINSFFASSLQNIIPVFASFLTTFAMFYILFKYIPAFKIPTKPLMISTLMSAFLFEIMKYLYTLYVLKFSSFQKIYGAYAFVVISIFWIYYISVIFSFSAAIGQIYLEKNNLKLTYKKK